MSFFNLQLVTLERSTVPQLCELRVTPLSHQRVLTTNCINTG